MTAALLSEEGQMKLEYGIAKPLHLLTVGGGKAKKKDKELIIGEVFDDITGIFAIAFTLDPGMRQNFHLFSTLFPRDFMHFHFS